MSSQAPGAAVLERVLPVPAVDDLDAETACYSTALGSELRRTTAPASPEPIG